MLLFENWTITNILFLSSGFGLFLSWRLVSSARSSVRPHLPSVSHEWKPLCPEYLSHSPSLRLGLCTVSVSIGLIRQNIAGRFSHCFRVQKTITSLKNDWQMIDFMRAQQFLLLIVNCQVRTQYTKASKKQTKKSAHQESNVFLAGRRRRDIIKLIMLQTRKIIR